MKVKTKSAQTANEETTKPQAGVPAPMQKAGTNLPALPGNWATDLAEAAKEDSAFEQPELQSFSTRAGVLSYNGSPMPDNKVRVIIVGYAFVNSLFINKFDPNNIVSPLCFAMNETGDDMQPHDNSFKKQGAILNEKEEVIGHECHGCEMMEWGSDTNSPSGRGKACKETRRLVCIPEDALAQGIEKASFAMFNVSVTSTGNWGNYVHKLSAVMKRPAWSVVTEILVKPHAKNQFESCFEAVEAINDGDQLAALRSLRERARQAALVPYGMMTQEQFDEITAEKEKPQKKRKF